jgi:hypothetical protein
VLLTWGRSRRSNQAVAQASPRLGAYEPGEALVRYRGVTGVGVSRALRLNRGESVHQAITVQRRDPRLVSVVPNYVARMSSFTPNDPGFPLQWNF